MGIDSPSLRVVTDQYGSKVMRRECCMRAHTDIDVDVDRLRYRYRFLDIGIAMIRYRYRDREIGM